MITPTSDFRFRANCISTPCVPRFCGEIFIAYAGLDIPVRFTFIDETVYLQVFEIKLKTSQEYLVEALETRCALRT